MKKLQLALYYLFGFFLIAALSPEVSCGESKHYEYDYHPPPHKKAQVDINIPIDFGTIAKLGVIGLTQLKLLLALGKVAGAGLGVGALGLGSLGKLALSIGPAHKGGISLDLGGHGHHHAKAPPPHYEEEEHHYVPEKYHYRAGGAGKY